MLDDLLFRDADPSEDDELARIMYNAFLPIWNHNWFQVLTSPLPPISDTSAPLTRPQAHRLAFYRSWLAFNRIHSGEVVVAYTPSVSSGHPSIAAVLLLLPPHARPSWFELGIAWRSGLLPSMLSFGLRGFLRIVLTFEGNVERMIGKALKERGIADGKQVNLLFTQGCVRDPEWKGGKGPARILFDWAVRRWWQRQREEGKVLTPVWLDTTTDEGVRAYEEIGFEVVGECMTAVDTDGTGIQLKSDADEKVKEEGRKAAKQRVMLRLPDA